MRRPVSSDAGYWGDDLAQMIAHKHGPFPPDHVLTAWRSAAGCVVICTRRPLNSPRRIKPQNLKLTARGRSSAGLWPSKGKRATYRRSHAASILGYTPHYAPPNRFKVSLRSQNRYEALAATLFNRLRKPLMLVASRRACKHQDDPLQRRTT